MSTEGGMGDNGCFEDDSRTVPAQTEDFQRLFLDDTPLMDVRAPIEFAKGTFPQSSNLPILDDEQRHEIGKLYADEGQDAAIEHGLELATPEIRQQRIEAWSQFVKDNPTGLLYCFRGGLRSRTTQAWLAEAGVDITLIKGGYKAMRSYLIEQLEQLSANAPMLLLAGATGSGKTLAVQEWHQSVDIEGKSLHRGSAFGGTFVPQPAQVSWENEITVDWIKRAHASDHPVLVEAESQLIGRIYVPHCLQDAMAKAPVVVIEMPLQERVQLLRDDYVTHALGHFQRTAPDDPWQALETHVSENLQRIRKRLGGERCDKLVAVVPGAVSALRDSDDWGGFDHIISVLLDEYYDKMYAHKMQDREKRAIFTGDRQAVLQWLAQTYP